MHTHIQRFVICFFSTLVFLLAPTLAFAEGPGPHETVYLPGSACKPLTGGLVYDGLGLRSTINNARVSCPIFHSGEVYHTAINGSGIPNSACAKVYLTIGNAVFEQPVGEGLTETSSSGSYALECELDNGDRLYGYNYSYEELPEDDELMGYMAASSCYVSSGSIDILSDRFYRASSSSATIRCPLLKSDRWDSNSEVIARLGGANDTATCALRSIGSSGGVEGVSGVGPITVNGFTTVSLETSAISDYIFLECTLSQGASLRGVYYEENYQSGDQNRQFDYRMTPTWACRAIDGSWQGLQDGGLRSNSSLSTIACPIVNSVPGPHGLRHADTINSAEYKLRWVWARIHNSLASNNASCQLLRVDESGGLTFSDRKFAAQTNNAQSISFYGSRSEIPYDQADMSEGSYYTLFCDLNQGDTIHGIRMVTDNDNNSGNS